MDIKNSEINYEELVHAALRTVVKDVLKNAANHGLTGEYHFYICFATGHPLVQIPDHLRAEYPEDMTIVIQHEYWDLAVEDDAFSITLCFDEIHERITIPFASIISFVDPSVKFGLQFNPIYPEEIESFDDENQDFIEPKLLDQDVEEAEKKIENNVVPIDFSKTKK